MNRQLTRILCALVILSFGINYAIAVADENIDLSLEAKSALLLDYDSGEIIYEKNINEKLAMASITKIMTILLALEAIDNNLLAEDDKVHVSAYSQSMGGSTAFLEEGEIFPVSTILKAIIVASANDASVAIAEKISGSHEAFVQKMNTRAKELGMMDTNFTNCTGLPDENHYSTAKDIAIMSRELLNKPLFFKWSSIWLDEMREGATMLKNTNNLVRFYDGCDGVKTGFTQDAMHCISASAERDGFRLISIILAAPTSKIRFAEASKLLDFGFANFESITLFKKDQLIEESKDIPVRKGKEDSINGIAQEKLSFLAKRELPKDYEFEWNIPDYIDAPIEKGEVIGTVRVKQQNKMIGELNIVSDKSVEVANIFDLFNKILDNWLRK
ncbi:MAG: D-alanyl-D-alanine carboxypeptidase [Clostridiales bacterium]|nr:D-alanyl-D-alanine carboxypeptidase [Clostridiales bacterium]